jgi:hypothetical protein
MAPFTHSSSAGTCGSEGIRVAYSAFIAFLAGLTFLVLTIADQERQAQAGVKSIPRYKIALRSALHADRSPASSNRSNSSTER